MKTDYVIDAGVAVKWFVPEIHSGIALRLLRKRFALQAPELIQAEFGNILRKKRRAGELDGTTAGEIPDNFKRSPPSGEPPHNGTRTALKNHGKRYPVFIHEHEDGD